jgi:hypothetical protein
LQLSPPPGPNPRLTGFESALRQAVFDLWFAADKWGELVNSEVLMTPGDTITTLDSFALEDETAYHIHSAILGVESGSGNRASYEIVGVFYRNGGGATQQGATDARLTVESDVNWACVFDTDTNDVRIRVTGVAATDISWRATTRILSLSN